MGGAARRPKHDGPRRRRPEGRRCTTQAPRGVTVNLTGASGMWSDFNDGQPHRDDAVRAVQLAGHPGDPGAGVRLAGGRRAAADADHHRPGRVAPACCSSARQVADISIWAMNFALMFALALGIDYALFIVVRFRAALFGSRAVAGRPRRRRWTPPARPCCSAALTVLISLTAVMLVPSPRSARWRSASWSRSSSCSPRR